MFIGSRFGAKVYIWIHNLEREKNEISILKEEHFTNEDKEASQQENTQT